MEGIYQPTVVSLMCGAGGMDFGFKLAGFKSILGLDLDKDSCDTYLSNIETEVYNVDILKVKPQEIPESDVIISSIITPSFSFDVRAKESNSNKYLNTILNIVKAKYPNIVVLECIKPFRGYEKGSLFDYLLKTLESLNYRVSYQDMNTMNYSIPQKRSKLVIIAVKKAFTDIRYEFPKPHAKPFTLGDIFNEIDTNTNVTIDLQLNRKGIKVFKLNEVSSTLVPSYKYYLNSPPFFKRITSVEASVIQSFPKDYIFCGSEVSRIRQICTAFPPALAYYIAKEILALFDLNGSNKMNNDLVNLANPQKLELDHNVNLLKEEENNLSIKLKSIQKGKKGAYDFEDCVFDIIKYIFDNQLKLGEKQYPINEGRKRVDIKFNTRSGKGFFGHLKLQYGINSAVIFIECKNYNEDLKNPDFNQLIGRFNRYSSFGIIVCNETEDKNKINQLCKDIVKDGKGYILVLEVTDLLNLISLRDKNKYEDIDDYMLNLLDSILFK